MSRNAVYAVFVFALAYAASFYFRIYVVDTPVSGAAGNVLLDALRQGVLFCQLNGVWGGLGLASGLLALFAGGKAVVYLWSILTALALANYNGDLGVIGLALGLLRLARF
ncbi:MAG: hypothetical protein P4L39_09830 [Humidesulfovibrio sp.]|nr:hypothetical protein [Humidesulfovibrio sp.]